MQDWIMQYCLIASFIEINMGFKWMSKHNLK